VLSCTNWREQPLCIISGHDFSSAGWGRNSSPGFLAAEGHRPGPEGLGADSCPPRGTPKRRAPGVLYVWSDCQMSADNSLRRLGEKEDPGCGMGEGFADFERRKQPLTPGFAVPSPLGPWERGVITSGPAVNPNVETRVPRLKGVLSLRSRGASPPLGMGPALPWLRLGESLMGRSHFRYPFVFLHIPGLFKRSDAEHSLPGRPRPEAAEQRVPHRGGHRRRDVQPRSPLFSRRTRMPPVAAPAPSPAYPDRDRHAEQLLWSRTHPACLGKPLLPLFRRSGPPQGRVLHRPDTQYGSL
jgi:hypothetical protein